jgi:hypothetical protein
MTLRLKDLDLACQALSRLTGRADLHIERGSRLYGRMWKLLGVGERILLRADSAKELLSLLDAYRDGYRDAGRKE